MTSEKEARLREYRSEEEYQEGAESFRQYCSIVLVALGSNSTATKDLIIRNFIARAAMMVSSIMELWRLSAFQDCWILHRCLIDRFFHLAHLGKEDTFDDFEAWSFFQEYKAAQRVRGDASLDSASRSQAIPPTPEQKKRYSMLLSSPPKWSMPKPKTIAGSLGLLFLYNYSYDFASRHVHPMAHDGAQDYCTVTGLQPAQPFPDQRSVLANSLLTGAMTVRTGLNASSFRWRGIVYDFLNHLLVYLDGGAPQHHRTLLRLAQLSTETELCEPRQP